MGKEGGLESVDGVAELTVDFELPQVWILYVAIFALGESNVLEYIPGMAAGAFHVAVAADQWISGSAVVERGNGPGASLVTSLAVGA